GRRLEPDPGPGGAAGRSQRRAAHLSLLAPAPDIHGTESAAGVTRYIGAIDQGTTSTRFIVFDESTRIVAESQKEHAQIYPQPGWVEHDPVEIWRNTQTVIAGALRAGNLAAGDLSAIGITNQRETTVVWNRR